VLDRRALEKRSILPSKLGDFIFERLEIYGLSCTVRPIIDRKNSNQHKAFGKATPQLTFGPAELVRDVAHTPHRYDPPWGEMKNVGSCLLDV